MTRRTHEDVEDDTAGRGRDVGRLCKQTLALEVDEHDRLHVCMAP